MEACAFVHRRGGGGGAWEGKETGHYAFSDFCLQASNCNPPITLTNDESHDAVLR